MISADGRPASCSAASAMVPRAGGAIPTIVFKTVDLPAPLRPSSATISFSCTSKATSWRIWLLP